MMGDKPWKRCEREIARLLGGERVPVSGRQRGDQPDVAHEWLSIEVKHRLSLPVWLVAALDQADAASRDGQLPVVVAHENGARYRDSLVVLRLSDFIEWFGGGSDDDASRR